jgi:hypothetical protein
MSGLLVSLLVIELGLSLAGLGAFVYRRRLEFREENTLILNPSEAHLLAGQDGIHARIRQLDSLLWYVGIGWFVFGIALFGVWLAEGVGLI